MKDFSSPGQFARHLAKLAAVGHEVTHLAADKCGKVIENSAKAEIGFYQKQHGPFPAWEELADSTEADKARNGYPIEAPLLRTGAMQKSISHTTHGNDVVIGSTDKKMVYHEFGTLHIPPRPVLGPAMYMNKDRILIGLSRVCASWVGGLSWKREPISKK